MRAVSGTKILTIMLVCAASLYFWTYYRLTDLNNVDLSFYIMFAVIILAVPALLWAVQKKSKFYSIPIPALWVLAIIINLSISGLLALKSLGGFFDTAIHDTYFLKAYHYQTLWISGILAFFAATTYWFHKSQRFHYRLLLAHLHFWLFICGALFVSYWVPMFFLIAAGMPRRYVDYENAYERWNTISQMGEVITIASLVVFALWVVGALMTKKRPAASIEATQ